MADRYRKRRQFDDAIVLCLEELKARPSYASARVVLARAYLERGDLAKAEEEFHRVVELSPENVRARVHLAQICEAQDRVNEAVSHYEAALALIPLDRAILASLSRLRRFTPAPHPMLSGVETKDDREVAADLPAPRSGENERDLFATETLADMYASQGLTDRAAAIYQQLLHNEPSRDGVRAKLKALSKRRESAAPPFTPPSRKSRDQMLLEELECWLQGIRRHRQMATGR